MYGIDVSIKVSWWLLCGEFDSLTKVLQSQNSFTQYIEACQKNLPPFPKSVCSTLHKVTVTVSILKYVWH